MKLIKFDDASKYYRRVEKHLLEHEAVNCLALASSLIFGNSDRHQPLYLALVESDRTILATAVQSVRSQNILIQVH